MAGCLRHRAEEGHSHSGAKRAYQWERENNAGGVHWILLICYRGKGLLVDSLSTTLNKRQTSVRYLKAHGAKTITWTGERAAPGECV